MSRPKITGFTIARNALQGGYPIIEALLSIAPLCDELVVVLDSSVPDDGTRGALEVLETSCGPVRILARPWPVREERENCLATATNWGIEACLEGDPEGWFVHVQADEVMHPAVLPAIKALITNPGDRTAALLKRMQLRYNFQELHAEHLVCRVGKAREIRSMGDALSMHVPGDRYVVLQPETFTLFDLTRCFIENFPGKSDAQAQVWWHNPNRNAGGWFGKTPEAWAAEVEGYRREGFPELWTRDWSPYGDAFPELVKLWLGVTRYYPLPQLLAGMAVPCRSHPNYRAVKPPTARCPECRVLWALAEGALTL